MGVTDVLCPACGALNTGDLGTTGHPYRKRFRLLYWTFTVRGTDSNFVEVESAFGLKTSYSLGRWVVSNILAIAVITVMVVVALSAWATTRSFFGWAILALLDAALIGWFVWTMTPPRKAK